jgi:hypothetical protein
MIAKPRTKEMIDNQLTETQIINYNNGMKIKRIFGNPQQPQVPTAIEWLVPKL